jgi:hypothetical protein
LKKLEVVSGFIKKIKGFPTILVFFGISQNCFCIGKIMDRVYGLRDHDWLAVHGGLTTMGWCGLSGARGGRRDSSKKEREGHRGSHQWRHLEAELWRWSHDDAQQRRLVVLRWGDGSWHEEERLELGWVQWIMGVLLSRLL